MPLSQIVAGSIANNITITTTGNVSANVISSGGSVVSPVTGFKNRIINGNFDIWQRGTSVTGVALGQFVADRWRTSTDGTTANVSRQAFTLGQTDVPGEPTYFHRTVVSSVAGSSNYCTLIHPIESVRTFAGQTVTLSFWAKADASKNIAVEFFQNFGTGGSPSSSITAIGVTTCALTTSWKKFTITVNIPSISGKTLGSDNIDSLRFLFWFDAGSTYNSRTNSLGQQSGTFDIAQVQLEAGPVATPFEQRPLGQELALCQRYYQVIAQITGTATSTTVVNAWSTLGIQMRTTPTSTQSGVLNFQGSDGSASTQSATGLGSAFHTPYSIYFIGIPNFSGLTTGRTASLGVPPNNGNYIILSAEI